MCGSAKRAYITYIALRPRVHCKHSRVWSSGERRLADEIVRAREHRRQRVSALAYLARLCNTFAKGKRKTTKIATGLPV